ncbi:MAG: ribosome biogenesis GTPase Der [Anaerolineae bacterium]
MKRLIKLALVGRPNVGKSALFNRICKKKIAIVDEAEGVTRDRLYAEAEFFGRKIQVIDTGGIDPHSGLPFQEEVRRQVEIALIEADAIVMVVDATIGVTTLDEEVARLLLRRRKPLCLAVNKVDDFSKIDLLHQFYSLGISRMVPVSATQGLYVAELLESALEEVSFEEDQESDEEGVKVAIVGRPNVGKSTLVNLLLKEERCVVSPIAGTTRDSIDIKISACGIPYTLIDTAGIRRKRAEHEAVDKFAAIRTQRAIERSDICILVLDAKEGLTVQEKRIASQIEEAGKGCILLFNKWDLIKGYRMEHCLKSVRLEASFLSHCPTFFVSAIEGRNLKDLFKHVGRVASQLKQRITTGQLNKFLERALQKIHPPMIQGKRLRIYYMAQVGIQPPHFILFVNKPELMTEAYRKYLINQFREVYQFSGAPLVFHLKGKLQREESLPALSQQAKEDGGGEDDQEEVYDPEECDSDPEELDTSIQFS